MEQETNSSADAELASALDYTPKINSIDVSKEQDKKLWKEIIKAGDGDETPGESTQVHVHYIGRLADGTEFDRSDRSGEPFKFTLGNGSVIRGWDEGVATMKRNEVSLLVCHPDYGYGSRQHGNIPANSTLYFEIELLNWEEEDLSPNKDGGILRRKICVGSKYGSPNEGATVELHLEGYYGGQLFESRDVKFELGEGRDLAIPSGVELALYKFCEKEKSTLTLQPEHAFGNEGNIEFGIPPQAVVTYIVELHSVVKAREAWELDGHEKLVNAREFKAKGTRYFGEAKFRLATAQYRKIVDFLKAEALLEGAEEMERKALLCAAYLNQSICYLKLDDHLNAKKNAEESLQLEPLNIKGWFRLGLAHLGLNEHEEAKASFDQVLAQEPSHKLAGQQRAICNQKIKSYKASEKVLFGNMFDKFARIDKQKELEALKTAPNGLDNLDEWEKGVGGSEQEENPKVNN